MVNKRVNSESIRRFRRALRQFERIVNEHSKRCCRQVSMPQCHLLLEIAAAGTATCSDLARLLRLDISTISRTADSLVEAGLIRRVENPGDRRSVIISCTKKGQDLCRSINRDADRFYGKVVARLQRGEQARILDSFETLVEAFADSELTSEKPSCCGTDGDNCTGDN